MRLRQMKKGSLVIRPRNQASARFQGLLSALLRKPISYAVDVSVEKICTNIDSRLEILLKKTILNFLILAGLNGLGILCFLLSPFGERLSKIFAHLFFFSSVVYSLVRFVGFVKNYGKQTMWIGKNIWKTKSISRGIECYIYSQYPSIKLFYQKLDYASCFVGALRQIPKINDFVRFIIRIYWKRLAVFGGILAFLYIMFYGIVRPLILLKCW